METPLNLTLFYTANIGGDLGLLPRLYTYLQNLQAGERQGKLLLDLGNSCADAVWHCRATGGRSTLMVLDGMGFDVANVEGLLDRASRDKLAAQVTMRLVDRERDWQYQAASVSDFGIRATLCPADSSTHLQLLLQPADRTGIEGNLLQLEAVSAGQIGEVKIDLAAAAAPRIHFARVHDLPPDTPLNPSIAAIVEFVESEAQLFQKKRK